MAFPASPAGRALVTGGGGFLGSHLVDALLATGQPVRIFDKPHLVRFRAADAAAGLEWFEGDFCNRADLASALSGCDMVFHLASTTLPKSSNDNPVYDVSTNVAGSIALMEESVRAGARRIVFLSSGGTVYGVPRNTPVDEDHPTNPIASYGITKLAIEKYLHLFHHARGLEYCVLRLANPFGPRQRPETAQGVVSTFVHRAHAREALEIWGDGSVVRDYIYVSDAVSAMLAASRWSGRAGVFNIGSGHGLSVNEVAEAIERVLGEPVKRNYHSARPFDVPVNVLDVRRAREALGWSAQVAFDDGIRRTLQFAMSQVGRQP